MANYVIKKSDTVELYTAMVMSLFDELVLENGDKEVTIPLYFAQGDRKYMAKHSHASKPYPLYGKLLPALSIAFIGTGYEDAFVNNPYLKHKGAGGKVSYQPTRTIMNYELTIVGKTMDEVTNLVSFIMQAFQLKEYYVNMKLPFFDKPTSTPIVIDDANFEVDMNDDVSDDIRKVYATIPLTVKNAMLINTVTATDTVIKRVDLRVWYNKLHTELLEEYRPLVEVKED